MKWIDAPSARYVQRVFRLSLSQGRGQGEGSSIVRSAVSIPLTSILSPGKERGGPAQAKGIVLRYSKPTLFVRKLCGEFSYEIVSDAHICSGVTRHPFAANPRDDRAFLRLAP